MLFFLFSLIFSGSEKANYLLILKFIEKGPGGKTEVIEIMSTFLHSIPVKDLDILIRHAKYY